MSGKERTVALCGNPNCGKTTLFNLLTASNMRVGNRSGVTVELSAGKWTKDKSVTIVDTPGARTLDDGTADERVAADFLLSRNADIAVCVIDACNPVAGLCLAAELAKNEIPFAIALNMWDEAQKGGVKINVDLLEKLTAKKVFPISAKNDVGVDELMNFCAKENVQSETRAAFSQNAAEIASACFAIPEGLHRRSDKIDKIVLNRFAALPIFAAIMLISFYLALGKYCGGALSAAIEKLTPALQSAATKLCERSASWVKGLIADGIIGGVMSVLGFLPQVVILYACISVLEDVGYMARVTVIFDSLLRKIGLGGKSAASLILGLGCSVPAIVSARTADTQSEREQAAILCPFVPCSAKLAVVSAIGAKIFGGSALFALGIYATCLLAIVICGLLLTTFGNGKDDLFLTELPPYRLPSAKSTLRQLKERAKSFVTKAGTTICLASIVIWLTCNFDFAFNAVSAENGMLAIVGKLISPIFTPIGFDADGFGWQLTVATISGLPAKEAILSTLEILLPPDAQISQASAFCFTLYNLLTVPCVATVGTCFAEAGKKVAFKAIIVNLTISYVVCLAIYQTSKSPKACVGIIIAAAICLAAIVLFGKNKKCSCSKCGSCKNCVK